jgi:hypothetical protein
MAVGRRTRKAMGYLRRYSVKGAETGRTWNAFLQAWIGALKTSDLSANTALQKTLSVNCRSHFYCWPQLFSCYVQVYGGERISWSRTLMCRTGRRQRRVGIQPLLLNVTRTPLRITSTNSGGMSALTESFMIPSPPFCPRYFFGGSPAPENSARRLPRWI